MALPCTPACRSTAGGAGGEGGGSKAYLISNDFACASRRWAASCRPRPRFRPAVLELLSMQRRIAMLGTVVAAASSSGGPVSWARLERALGWHLLRLDLCLTLPPFALLTFFFRLNAGMFCCRGWQEENSRRAKSSAT